MSKRYFFFGTPPFIYQILFFILPLVLLLISAFSILSPEGESLGMGFANFVPFLTLPYLSILINTLFIGLLTAFICLCIAYPLTYFIVFVARKYRYVFLFFLLVPFWTNFLLHVYAWFFILEPGGFLNRFLMGIGLTSHPIHFFNSLFAVVLMMVYIYLPFMVLPIYSSLERFPTELIEASYDLGANWFQTFRRVIIPITLPAVRAGFFLVLVPSFGEFIIPELMGGDKYYFVGNVITQLVMGETTGMLGAAYTFIAIVFIFLALIVFSLVFSLISKKIDRRVA